ncbi:anhydro-N-acetylmuramic acid kinase, partial [Stenotrophomonas sp. P5_B8]
MTAVVDPHSPLFIGLMSGTSADGIDAALVQFPAEGGCRFVHGHTHPWDPALRAELIALGEGGDIASLDALGRIDAEVGLRFAEAATALLRLSGVDRAQVRAIGSHGQTVRHRPLADP